MAADLMTATGPIGGRRRPGRSPASRWRRGRRAIDEIERELAKIWAVPDLTDDRSSGVEERHVAARTSVMNLVVIARRPGGRRALRRDHRRSSTGRHPSRTLDLLAGRPRRPGAGSTPRSPPTACCPRAGRAGDLRRARSTSPRGGETGRHIAAIVDAAARSTTCRSPSGGRASRRSARSRRTTCSRWPTGSSSTARAGAATGSTALARAGRPASSAADRRVFDFALVRQSRWREAIASTFDLPGLPAVPPLHPADRGDLRRPRRARPPGTTNIVKPLYHVAWIASRLGMAVSRPLAPLGTATGGGGVAAAGRPTERRTWPGRAAAGRAGTSARSRSPARLRRDAPPRPHGGRRGDAPGAVRDAVRDDPPRRAARRPARVRAADRRHRRGGDGRRPRLAGRRRGPRPAVHGAAPDGDRPARRGDRVPAARHRGRGCDPDGRPDRRRAARGRRRA